MPAIVANILDIANNRGGNSQHCWQRTPPSPLLSTPAFVICWVSLQTNSSNNDHKGVSHQLAIVVKQLIYRRVAPIDHV